MSRLQLSKEEARLRDLLLDTADYAGSRGCGETPHLRFAGGWVRDKLLGINSPDIDIAVNNMTGLKFAHMMKDFVSEPNGRRKYDMETLSRISEIPARPEQSKHLETATLKVFGLAIDLVNLRKETYSEDSRNPQMEFGTPEEDALRRDATINSLFYNLITEEVEDLTGMGLLDMQHKIIRTPLTPFQTFKDDPLRVLRCIRFASRLGYSIDADAESAMRDPSIQESLRLKITRERVGVEVEKMLKGPHPESALAYIDRLGLYNVIFTDPSQQSLGNPHLGDWSNTYRLVTKIVRGTETPLFSNLRSTLLIEENEVYIAWLLCALTPWAPLITNRAYVPKKGQPKSFAALAAREGLKIDNKSRDVIDKSMTRLDEVISLKNLVIEMHNGAGSASEKRKGEGISRADLGMKLYEWGPSWRSNVLLAVLVESVQSENVHESTCKLDEYNKFLNSLRERNLLEAHQMKPTMDGNRLMEVIGRKAGPWMKEATRVLVRWQFQHPGANEGSEGIDEVLSQFRE